MTRSDTIERRENDSSSDPSASERHAMATKRQLIVTAVISILIGICIGIIAVHLLSGTAPGLEGQWRHYMRF
jgi:hypothetical protein